MPISCPHCKKSIFLSITAETEEMPNFDKPSAKATDFHSARPRVNTDENPVEELKELLDGIDEAQCRDGKDADFAADMRGRFAQYGPRTKVSPKQLVWLRRIRDNQ